MNKALTIIPTYNERRSITAVINSVLKHEDIDILIIDDASPDGTAEAVKNIMSSEKRVFLIERPGKLGLGTAYIAGFKWGLEKNYDYFIEMDADGSHNPETLPWFIKEMEKGYDLVMGSRYIDGKISVVGWDFHRLLISKFGNLYASRLLKLPYTDLTSGFRCYSRKALESVNLGRVKSNGYAFQIEMVYWIKNSGLKISEMPIIFYERNSGSSKMSREIVWEAAGLPWKLRFEMLKAVIKGSR
ncbi:MAG: polyprenol monophosphomannose synthase [Nitrospirae bacterium]|nr:polyprenol monophosphomannose synthase [Nitrospirota bacterium]